MTGSSETRLARRLTRRHFALTGAAVAGVGVVAAVRGGELPSAAVQAPATPGALDDKLNVTTNGWETDFSKHSVNLSSISSGGPPRDGIPPIDDPAYVSIAEADEWLEATEPVISIAIEKDGETFARAYPLQIMIWHEIVNDELGGEPVLSTFCPLCNTAIAFDRRLEPGGTVYDFGTTGNLRLSDLVMWDRQTESWWQQLTGEAIVGELTGTELRAIPAQILGWEAFKEAYPEGDVLSRDTGFDRPYGSNPYGGYDDIDSSPFLFDGELDGRLKPMARVVGLDLEGETAAYPFTALEDTRVVNDELAGQEVAVLYAPGARSALDESTIAESRDVGQAGVFSRTLDGQQLTFEAEGDDRFVDAETGTVWDVTGQGLAGPLAGEQLTAFPHTVVFWFAWAAAFPETNLWAASGA